MNSKKKTKQTLDEDVDIECVELEDQILGQSVKFKEKIERIKDIGQVNILEWFKDFKTSMNKTIGHKKT